VCGRVFLAVGWWRVPLGDAFRLLHNWTLDKCSYSPTIQIPVALVTPYRKVVAVLNYCACNTF